MAESMEQRLYHNVSARNIEQIKALHRAGAGLEWISADGKTPLIEACGGYYCNYGVTKTLIELGANVNAYRPGPLGGTPLHQAARIGSSRTVKLLLSSGATALTLNDDSKTPLDIARANGYTNIVGEIEKHTALFTGWLGLCGVYFFSSKMWVVIMPRASRDLCEHLKLELLIYARQEDARPCKIVPLWEANLDEPNFNRFNPTAIIYEPSTSTRLKLTPLSEDKKHHLKSFCDACKGMPPVRVSELASNNQRPSDRPSNSQRTTRIHPSNNQWPSDRPSNNQRTTRIHPANNQRPSDRPSNNQRTTSIHPSNNQRPSVRPSNDQMPLPNNYSEEEELAMAISASLVIAENGRQRDAHNQHVDIVSGIVKAVEDLSPHASVQEPKNTAPCCIICLDGPVEGACIPCGHMMGCMSCLNELKGKESGCPVCRAKIDQVIRIYSAV